MTRATARLFVAVDPPTEVCGALAGWARTAMGAPGGREPGSSPVRLLVPELLHITLCFLGDRPIEEVAAIEAAMEECAMAVGELSIGAPLWLPPRRPRALAVEVHDDPYGGLSALHAALVQALSQRCGFREERRRFRAHVTLSRMRDSPRGSAAVHALPATPMRSFIPAAIVLYRSWLSPEGASYEALASRTLVPS